MREPESGCTCGMHLPPGEQWRSDACRVHGVREPEHTTNDDHQAAVVERDTRVRVRDPEKLCPECGCDLSRGQHMGGCPVDPDPDPDDAPKVREPCAECHAGVHRDVQMHTAECSSAPWIFPEARQALDRLRHWAEIGYEASFGPEGSNARADADIVARALTLGEDAREELGGRDGR